MQAIGIQSSQLTQMSLLEAGRPSSSSTMNPARLRPVYVNRIPENFGTRRPGERAKAAASANRSQSITSSGEPLLRWGNLDIYGVTSSGWNPFRGANVCFKDETNTEDKITLIIEPPAPGAGYSLAAVLCVPYWPVIYHEVASRSEAHGYFFEKNKETGKIDMMHRSKPFRGIEERKLYKDCTYFDVIIEKKKYPDGEIREESVFVLTSGYSDKHFPTGVNFSSSSSEDLSIIVKAINALIYSVQGDIDISASARVYPLFCTHIEFENQCRAHDHEIATAQSQDNSEASTEYSSEDDEAPHYIATSAVEIVYPGKRNYQQIYPLDVDEEEISAIELHAICINSPPMVVIARV